MGRKSRLASLPDIKNLLDKLIQEGSYTQKQIAEFATDYAVGLGINVPITEKVVNRYAASFKDIMEKRQESALVVKQWVNRMGDIPAGDFGRAIVEIMRQLSFDMSIAIHQNDMTDLPETVKMLKDLATAVDKVERSAKVNQADILSIQLDTLKRHAAFVKANYPQHEAVALEILQPFGQELSHGDR